jgi:hypothetical protein
MRRAHGKHPTYWLKQLIMVGQILSILQMTKLVAKLLTFCQFFISKETCNTMNISPRTLEVHTKLLKLENCHYLKLEFSCGLCFDLSSYSARFPYLNLYTFAHIMHNGEKIALAPNEGDNEAEPKKGIQPP